MHSPDFKIHVINCLASDVIKGHIMNLNLGTYWLPTWNTFSMMKIDKEHCFLTALQILKVQYLPKVNESCDFVSFPEKNCILKNSFLFYTSWLRELKIIGFRVLVKSVPFYMSKCFHWLEVYLQKLANNACLPILLWGDISLTLL